MEVCERSIRVCMAIIFIRAFGMPLLAKNSDVKASPIQTEMIGMQSPLRNGIITGHLPRKYHEPIPFS